MLKQRLLISIMMVSAALFINCGKKLFVGSINLPPSGTDDVDFWLTKSDHSVLLQKQPVMLSFGTTSNTYSNIDVDTSHTYQTIDGFGFTLTGGSAYVINQLNSTNKASLLKELFGNDVNSIGISYLRVSIGASDLNASV